MLKIIRKDLRKTRRQTLYFKRANKYFNKGLLDESDIYWLQNMEGTSDLLLMYPNFKFSFEYLEYLIRNGYLDHVLSYLIKHGKTNEFNKMLLKFHYPVLAGVEL